MSLHGVYGYQVKLYQYDIVWYPSLTYNHSHTSAHTHTCTHAHMHTHTHIQPYPHTLTYNIQHTHSHNHTLPHTTHIPAHIHLHCQVDQFLDSLIKFDKENIHDSNLQAIRPYLDNPEFEPDFIRSKSLAAAGLCSWAVNIVRFYEVFCDVEPKRKALAAANAELAAARDKLAKITAKIQVIRNCWKASSRLIPSECTQTSLSYNLYVRYRCCT